MRVVFFDLISGASGDMIVAALCDCGVPAQWLAEQFGRMQLGELKFGLEKVHRSGITCTHLLIEAPSGHCNRNLDDLVNIIDAANFSATVNERCRRMLRRLAEAEAKVHGVSIDKVHFHEIGALDTIIDVVGTALCLEYLNINEVRFSDLTVGRGKIETAHGIMPSPAPATVEMLKGFHVRDMNIEEEILTPTGCAILTALGTQVQGIPSGRVEAAGYGCGDKTFQTLPNILRAVIVDTEMTGGEAQDVAVIESELDHISGEVMAYAAQRLAEAGAFDVSWTPVFMKKGRPGYRLTVVAPPQRIAELASIAMTETRTLGVRIGRTQRICAARSARSIEFMGQEAREKLCTVCGKSFVKLEFDSLASIARKSGKPLLEVMEEYEKRKGAII